MMTNLFSTFDPSSSFMSLAWTVLLLSMLVTPSLMWKYHAPFLKLTKKMIATFKKEVGFNLNKSEMGTQSMILLPFITILMLNIMALYPQNFSPTSHLTITLPLSLLFWSSSLLLGWFKNTKHMLAHLVPQGTPSALTVFMVVIELISTMIRPITLCVRLTANLIAGHLLLTLLGNALMSLPFQMSMLTTPAPMLLTILESAVACIQAYVFMTLITLYVTETK